MDKTTHLPHPRPALPQEKKQGVCHILLIEDSLVRALKLRAVLEVEDFVVKVVGDSAAAIEQAQKHKFDLIVLDIELPAANGYETCRCLETDPATTGIPVIILIARNHPFDTLTDLELDIIDYIPKDFSAETILVQTIRSLNKEQ